MSGRSEGRGERLCVREKRKERERMRETQTE